MSGFEVAGIILGVFPVVLGTLRHYKDLKEGWENWRMIRRELEACLNDLEVQQTFFKQNLRWLLDPLEEPQRIEALLAHPEDDGWENPDLKWALHQRLRYTHDSYMNTVRSMQHLVGSARENLRIEFLEARLIRNDDSVKSHASEPASRGQSIRTEIKYQRSRLRFCIGQATRKEFFNKLQKHNDTLRELLESNDKLQFPRKNAFLNRHTRPMAQAEICEFWRHAQEVYQAFSGAWTCICREQHQTQLMLQHRLDSDKEMHLILRESSPGRNGVPSGRVVAIRESRDYSVMDRKLITSLCDKITEGFESDLCSEYLQGHAHKYSISAKAGPPDRLDLRQPSLEDILRGSGGNINRRQKYTISLILVSSFIQLRETPWFTSPWEKASVVFLEQREYPGKSTLHAPFLTHRLQPAPAVDSKSDLPMQDFDSLAIILLELCFGKVIENHPDRPRLESGVENARTKAALDTYAAKVWLQDVTNEAGPEYQNAIAWCLSRHTTVCGLGWKEEMFQQVVRPLLEITRPWASLS